VIVGDHDDAKLHVGILLWCEALVEIGTAGGRYECIPSSHVDVF
jgi:hypothetical protein